LALKYLKVFCYLYCN